MEVCNDPREKSHLKLFEDDTEGQYLKAMPDSSLLQLPREEAPNPQLDPAEKMEA